MAADAARAAEQTKTDQQLKLKNDQELKEAEALQKKAEQELKEADARAAAAQAPPAPRKEKESYNGAGLGALSPTPMKQNRTAAVRPTYLDMSTPHAEDAFDPNDINAQYEGMNNIPIKPMSWTMWSKQYIRNSSTSATSITARWS